MNNWNQDNWFDVSMGLYLVEVGSLIVTFFWFEKKFQWVSISRLFSVFVFVGLILFDLKRSFQK